MFFESYTEKVWGRHPRDISADWGAQRVKGVSIKEVLINAVRRKCHFNTEVKETSFIEQFLYPELGPGQLWERVAGKIQEYTERAEIRYNSKVTGIAFHEDGTIKGVKVLDGENSKLELCDAIFSSMPSKELVLQLEREVPAKICEIAKGLPYRDFVTVGITIPKNKLITVEHPVNKMRDCWIYIQEKDVRMGRIQIFNNWSKKMVENEKEEISLGLEYFCQEGDKFWNMNDEKWAEFAAEELVKLGMLEDVKDVKKYHVEKVRKAYPAYFDTYKDMDQLIAYLNTIDQLYCIGRNGQHRYNNMDHSMKTAMIAVNYMLETEKGKKGLDKTDIWKVNTEQEYHEK